jgi:hypothetical protein
MNNCNHKAEYIEMTVSSEGSSWNIWRCEDCQKAYKQWRKRLLANEYRG